MASRLSLTLLAYLSLATILLSPNVFALTKKAFKDHQSIRAEISATEINRIFVDHDRIQAVRGAEGTYSIKNDATYGHIYLQTTAEYRHKIFSIFITTEQGRHLTLILNPIDITAQTIALIPQTPAIQVAAAWEESSSYEQSILRLISAMAKNDLPEGYVVIPEGQAQTTALGNQLKAQLMLTYLGANLRGEVLRLKNRSITHLRLNPQDFYQSRTKALAIQRDALAPNQTTLLFRVLGEMREKGEK